MAYGRGSQALRFRRSIEGMRWEDMPSEVSSTGAFMIRRMEVRPFSAKQISLLETFANQAVIAIENTRLFEAERESKRELQESLEYQSATSEVLSVISRSPSRVQPVLDRILETAARLCHAEHATAFRLEDGHCVLTATNQSDPAFGKYLVDHPVVVDANSATGRAVVQRCAIHVPDVLAVPTYTSLVGQLANTRTILAVPLLRDGIPIGVLTMGRTKAQPFSNKQVELVETFADQAVIAIENTRLFEEVQARNRDLTALDEVGRLGYAELMQEGFYEPQGPKSLDAPVSAATASICSASSTPCSTLRRSNPVSSL
jgi:GAF domain-containing protein